MTAENAVALAGGFTDRAMTSTIYVRHKGERRERELAADDTTRIQPGDVLRVEKTTYWALMTLLTPLISPFSAIAYLLK
jgi:protein involved in polysaccharide export with SLBB domain